MLRGRTEPMRDQVPGERRNSHNLYSMYFIRMNRSTKMCQGVHALHMGKCENNTKFYSVNLKSDLADQDADDRIQGKR